LATAAPGPIVAFHNAEGREAMGYMRQHSDSGRVRAVACVVGEPGRFLVHLTEGDAHTYWSHEGLHYYHSCDVAFAAADVLARHHLKGHECGVECSGWVEPS
jgi:hypothetical protein